MKKLFSDIYGQKSAVKILTAQLKNERLSHAYLFLGNEGIGKVYLAKEFSKYLLCDNLGDDDCQNCTLYAKNNHPDFIFVDGKDGIKIDDMREVIERLSLSPNISKRKVALITYAENTGIEAANAILKTLEEPPLDSVIILTSISTKSLPETIVSRSQQIKLMPLTLADISKIIEDETGQKSPDDLISLAAGNIGEAKKIVSDESYKQEKQEFFAAIETLLFSSSTVEKFTLLEKYDKNEQLTKLADLLFYVVSESLDNTKTKNDSDFFNRVRNDISISKRVRLLVNMLNIYKNLKYNVNLRLSLEGLLLEQNIYD